MVLVTAFYDLARREPTTPRRGADFYLAQGEFVFGLNQDVIFFCDPELRPHIVQRRRAHGLLHRTQLIDRPLEAMPAYAHRAAIADARARNPVINANPEKDTPLYIVFTWCKFGMLREAISADPFSGTHFAWIDLGIRHVARVEHCLHDGIFARPSERVKLLMLKSFRSEELTDKKDYYSYIQGHLAAGYMSASRGFAQHIADGFSCEAEGALKAGYAPSDEQLLPVLAHRRPELFEFFYGDYRHILENYVTVRGSGENLLFQMRHCRNVGDFRRACEIGSRVLAIHKNGTFEVSAEYVSALLDEYFIAAYYLEYPVQTVASGIGRYYAQLVGRDPAFRQAFLENQDHIRDNFSHLSEKIPL